MPAIISIGEPLPELIWEDLLNHWIPLEHPVMFFIRDLILTGIIDRDKSGLILIAEPGTKTLEEIAVQAKIFPSKGQARKNNFAGIISSGISVQGTKANPLWIWNRPLNFKFEDFKNEE